MTDGLIAVFRKNVLVHIGNPIPDGFLQEYDTIHLGPGVFDAGMFPPDLHLMIKGAGDRHPVGTTFIGGFRTNMKNLTARNNVFLPDPSCGLCHSHSRTSRCAGD